MGSIVRITIYAPSVDSAKAAFTAAFARIAQLDDILSDYKADSELDRVSREAHDHPVRVSDDLWRVLVAAQRISRETGGAFDVTVGPLTHLWREARSQNRIPDAGAIAVARAHCGWRNMVLDRQTVYLKLDGMQLDVGGIAKGYAADEAIKVLRAHGISRALVACSGDIAASDAPPGEKGWSIGLESGDPVVLHDRGISTSGDTEQFVEAGGVRYSHIIDPATGMGLTTRIEVTVIAHDGMTADAMATAISVLGRERGLTYAKRQGVMATIRD